MKPAAALRAVIYARVSTADQDVGAQLGAVRPWVESRGWVVVGEESDQVTGDPGRRSGDPPGLRAALRRIETREADVLAVFAADRLIRSPVGLLGLVSRIQSYGGAVASYQDGADLDTTSDLGELMVFLRGWFGRMSLKLTRARTLAGVARARAQGKRLGRPPVVVDLRRLAKMHKAGRPIARIARRLGVSRATVRQQLAKMGGAGPPAEVAERRGLQDAI